ncbi:MAG: hypothetical protein AAGC45_13575 [Bacteroidota bacterium]
MKKLFASVFFGAVTLVVILFFGIGGYYFETGYPAWVIMALAMLTGVILVFILKWGLSKIFPLLKKMPLEGYTSIFAGALALFLLRMYAFRWPAVLFYPLAIFLLMCSVLTLYGIRQMVKKSNFRIGVLMVSVPIILVLGSILGFQFLDGDPHKAKTKDKTPKNVIPLSQSDIKNPSEEGPYEVETFTYGSGSDKKRPEYAEGVKIKTPTVDGSLLLPDWKGKKKKWRERFWGFGVENFPLNGRVYLPKGKGPFPLVLIVHGNHSMVDFSDDGYGYLGNLLASRGIITVSVDENFINGHWSGDFRGKEMPTRGWLLLKHLELWKSWNTGENEVLEGKVDMDKIVLIGHSRGGEAVSVAAAFNTLTYFPDNAMERFNFNFGIKGIVTIAPTDYRYHRQITLTNINYLSLQGAWDADETSFWGMRPYHRLIFSNDFKGFKAGLYMNHANHGQFNSTWGRSDFGYPMGWLLNLRPLVSDKAQQQVAKVYISAFVDAVLKTNETYIPLFQNADLAGDWLPEEDYLTQYSDHRKRMLLDFEEDIEVATGPIGIGIDVEYVKLWREEQLTARDGGKQENSALVLGWSYAREHQTDSLPRYNIHLPDVLMDLSHVDTLTLSVAVGDISELNINERKHPKHKDFNSGFNFSLVLKDRLGNTASVGFMEHNTLPKKIRSKFTKFKFLDKEIMGKDSEVQLKSCYVPMSAFKAQTDSLHLDKIKSLHFVFDKDSLGVLYFDDIGLLPK